MPAASAWDRAKAPKPAPAEPPLAGTLVVDLSRYLPGPLTAKLLADLGARVVKIEEPRLGDPVRETPPWIGGRSALAAQLLSGVESVALDLKKEAALQVLDRLLSRADVLLASFRPGTLERLALGPKTLTARHPRLVVCTLTGWGQDGPHAPRAGHDLTYQALAGTLASTVAPGPAGEPAHGMPAVQTADLTGAWSAATAILAALLRRHRTGRGGHVDASLYDAALHANLATWAAAAAETGAKAPLGEPRYLTGALPCYALYLTADGRYLALAALERKFWKRFCQLAGHEELIRLQYRTDQPSRGAVARLIHRRTLAQWTQLLAGQDLPIEPVLTAEEAQSHPQAQARAVLETPEDGLPRLAFPAKLDGHRPQADHRYPKLGADTQSILQELGLRPNLLASLSQSRQGIGRKLSLRRWLGRAVAKLKSKPPQT